VGKGEKMNKFKGYWEKQKTLGYITNKQKFQLAFPQMPLSIQGINILI